MRAANPETYIRSNAPPFFIQHGTHDQTVPVQQSIQFAARLRQVLGEDKVILELLERAGHADPGFETPENVKKVLDFLDRRLKLCSRLIPEVRRLWLSRRDQHRSRRPGRTRPHAPPWGGFPCHDRDASVPGSRLCDRLSCAEARPLPAGWAGPFPVVLIVHGGAFMFGDKSHDISMAGTDQLLGRGYAVANVNYRLSGEAKAPAQIQDVKTAVRWLRAHAGEYRLNPHKIGAWGSSAGANLVALLGTSGGVAALEGADLGHAEQSSRVQAVVDWFGPIDFLQMDAQFRGTPCPADHDAPDSPESQLIGAPIQTRPDLVKVVNPITYVSPEAAPFLIQHGTGRLRGAAGAEPTAVRCPPAAIGADKVQLTLLARRATRRRPAVLDRMPTCSGCSISWIAS